MFVIIGDMNQDRYSPVIDRSRTPDGLEIDMASIIDGTARLPEGRRCDVYITTDDFYGLTQGPASMMHRGPVARRVMSAHIAVLEWLQKNYTEIGLLVLVDQDLQTLLRDPKHPHLSDNRVLVAH